MPGLTAAAKKLDNILTGVECKTTGKVGSVIIKGLSADSRTVRPGDLFAAVAGRNFDGHDFIDQAITNGCAAVLVNRERIGSPAATIAERVAVIEVEDTVLRVPTVKPPHRTWLKPC